MTSEDTPNLITGLTLREIREIRSTWTIIRKKLTPNGIDLFINFFKRYPGHQEIFTKFKENPVESLRTNEQLIAHSNAVMYAVSAVVENLEKPDGLREMLIKLGRNHNRDLVCEQAFVDLKSEILHWLQEKLERKLTPSGVIAWDKALQLVNSIIAQGMALGPAPTD